VLDRRRAAWDAVTASDYDVAIIGAGINGASAYAELCRRGYRVLLLDRGDFGGGCSQASAMWVWGGFIYLATLDFATVAKLCASRDRLIREVPDWVHLTQNRHVATREDRRSAGFVKLALWLYWALSACRRAAPQGQHDFPERHFLRGERITESLLYEEAKVLPSDARFVAHWILPWIDTERPALNYCEVAGGHPPAEGLWRIELRDRITGREGVARARWVVNAAGVWTDGVNQRFGIESGWKHVYSKGVFIVLRRDPSHATPLIFENRLHDAYSFIPWGPVALWGPTETVAADPDSGFVPDASDVRTLLDEINRHVVRPVAVDDIIALRSGVRPLAVRRDYKSDQYTLNISRRHVVERNPRSPWINLYGGKISSCLTLGAEVADAIGRALPDARLRPEPPRNGRPAEPTDRFPGLEDPILSPRVAVEREYCWTLEDYLRRRTNLAQWVPRHGLGSRGEHAKRLIELAETFPGADGMRGADAAAAYQATVEREFDRVLAAV
jgi:glycerol-3-phosphate dehydrogenase